MESGRKINAVKAKAILAKNGLNVNDEVAKAILDYLYMIGDIAVAKMNLTQENKVIPINKAKSA